MPIVTQQKDISIHIDPISFTAELEILSGNIAQTYNNETKEFEPDRSVVPCLIMPYVEVSDPEGVMNGKRTITSVEWYEGAPKEDNSNRITNGIYYTISDSGTPTYSLKIKKNVEPNNPLQITSIFTITDSRNNTELKFEKSINLYTDLYNVINYSLTLDKPKSWIIDPLKEVSGEDGKWSHTITAQLLTGLQKVPDENAAYWWKINKENTGWRDITQEELNTFISGKDSEGNWTKNLTFDARFIQNVAFKCYSRYYVGERPTLSDSTLVAVSTVSVQLPRSLNVQIRQLAGSKIKSDMNTTVKFECVLYYNKNIIGTDKDDFFKITWKVHSTKPGMADKVIGTGRTISFVPSSLGLDKNYGNGIYAEVELYTVTEAVMREDGRVSLTGDGKIETIKIYK